LCSHIFIIHNDHTYITEDYTSLCLSIICNRSFFILKWCQLCSGPSFTQGWKDIGAKTYLFTACANCYLRFQGKVIFKTGNSPSTWSWLNAVVRFECENSAIDVIINFVWKIFHKPIVLVVVLTTANYGVFSNFSRYYTRFQMGKSTGYPPTLKPLPPPPSWHPYWMSDRNSMKSNFLKPS
jgi:hypothetical protein